MTASQLMRMDNIGIVVESLEDAVSFLTELGPSCPGVHGIENIQQCRAHSS